MTTVGFVGLGSMGSVLAANLVGAGHTVLTYDICGPATSPSGASFARSVTEIAGSAETIVFSLPNGDGCQQVADEIARVPDRRTRFIVDTSTIGIAAAETIDALLGEAGIGYVDAPVSGGVASARARTLAVMYAAPRSVCDEVAPIIAGLSDRQRKVGERAGMAQALKLANNFLSATALAATSEAIAFGISAGLDMGTMLEVLNTSSGQSAATSDKFVNHVLTERYAAGFTNTLMTKDLQLYLDAVTDQAGPLVLGPTTAKVWADFAAADPHADFTKIYPYIAHESDH